MFRWKKIWYNPFGKFVSKIYEKNLNDEAHWPWNLPGNFASLNDSKEKGVNEYLTPFKRFSSNISFKKSSISPRLFEFLT